MNEEKTLSTVAEEVYQRRHIVRRLYDWVLHWADTPYGTLALFILAFAESSFFPIPPDILLIALAVSIPKRAFRYALICSIGSVLGGCLGYGLGYFLSEAAVMSIVEHMHWQETFEAVRVKYDLYEVWAVGIAGFTPIPYKVFTISAGLFELDFFWFVVASAVSRSARFFIVGSLIYAFGPKMRVFIDKYFNWLSIAFVVLLVGCFILLKLILH